MLKNGRDLTGLLFGHAGERIGVDGPTILGAGVRIPHKPGKSAEPEIFIDLVKALAGNRLHKVDGLAGRIPEEALRKKMAENARVYAEFGDKGLLKFRRQEVLLSDIVERLGGIIDRLFMHLHGSAVTVDETEIQSIRELILKLSPNMTFTSSVGSETQTKTQHAFSRLWWLTQPA